MKKYLFQILALTMLMVATQSCFQDLDNDPPFNFPQMPPPPPPPADGLVFHMPFNGNFVEAQSEIAATVVGTPTFAPGVEGQAFQGAANSYLTFNMSDLVYELDEDFTVAFWYNINASPDRAGILTITPGTPDTRTRGLRIFREGSAYRQVIMGILGTGGGDAWLAGGDAAALNPNFAEWVHVTLTVEGGRAALFFDAQQVVGINFDGISWEDCTVISIGSGAPGFSEWNHLSDQSLIDDVRIYNRALEVDEIATLADTNPPLEMNGQVFFAPFDHSFRNIVAGMNPTIEGIPTLVPGKVGMAFAGAVDSYLTFGIQNMVEALTDELTIAFWYNLNTERDRAGIFTITTGVQTLGEGLRIFREGGANAPQNVRMVIGRAGGYAWLANTPVIPVGEWTHIAYVIDADSATIFINGEVAASVGAPYFVGGVNFGASTIMSVGAGGPGFSEWNHLSDTSLIDDLRIFDRALSEAEIAAIIEHAN